MPKGIPSLKGSKKCLFCQKNFTRKAGLSDKQWDSRLWCCSSCREKQQHPQRNWKGSNHPSWRGGLKLERPYGLKKKENIAGRKKPEQCELCGAMGVICFDHCHKTGRFRGWIYKRCNMTLGMVKDNTELLLAMINYLKTHGQE